MHVSKDFLLEAVGLSLLVGLLLFGIQMFERATDFLRLFDAKQESQIEKMEEYEICRFDGRRIDGISACNYIKKMVYQYEIVVQVETEKTVFTVSDEQKCEQIGEEESEYFIPPFVFYQCEVERDENGSIKSVRLTETEGE